MVRLLTPADAAAFQALRLEALTQAPSAFGSTAEEEAGRSIAEVADSLGVDAGRQVFGAVAGSVLVGIVAVGREPGTKERHRGFIRSLYLQPAHRGQGIARALMQAALDCAAQMPGLFQLSLSVTAGNMAAERLYAAYGFVRCGLVPMALQVDGVFYDEIMMTRPMPAVD